MGYYVHDCGRRVWVDEPVLWPQADLYVWDAGQSCWSNTCPRCGAIVRVCDLSDDTGPEVVGVRRKRRGSQVLR